MIAASNYGQAEDSGEALELTDEENEIIANVKVNLNQ